MRAEGPMQIADLSNGAGKVHRSFVGKSAPQDDHGTPEIDIVTRSTFVQRYRPMGRLDRRLDFFRNHDARTHWPGMKALSKYQD